jgi:hypothetical protein
MDAYTQYARWRRAGHLGLRNRRLAGMIGDFVYETSSAEDESRRILERLYESGKQALSTKADLKDLERFTSEHNREQRRSGGLKEMNVSWGRIDQLSRSIVNVLSRAVERTDPEFIENLAALDRMFSTTEALRRIRNQVDHRAPSDHGGPLHFYRDSGTPVTVRAIWGWTEVAASYWTNLTFVDAAISLATQTVSPMSRLFSKSLVLQWPPAEISIHGLRVLKESGIPIPKRHMLEARQEWASVTRRWNKKDSQ